MPFVTVLRDRYVPAPDGTPYEAGACHGVELAEALTRAYPTDAHFTAYRPVEPTAGIVVRLDREAVGAVPIEMVALVGDLDDPVAHATGQPAAIEWRASVEPALDATGLAWYRTRGGARIVAELASPFPISSKEDSAAWTERHAAWRAELLEQHGLDLDPLDDWARLYRLPRVVRNGEVQDAPIQGALRLVALPASRGPVRAAPVDLPAPASRPEAAYLAAIGATVAALGDPREWQGRRWHLVGALGGLLRKSDWPRDAAEALIRRWLDVGDPRIDVAHGVRWAMGAWERTADEVSGSQAVIGLVGPELGRLLEQAAMIPWRAGRTVPGLGASAPATIGAPEIPGWRVRRFSDPEETIEWRCQGLALAPSRGKISLIAGQPGAGKGPIADHLALCLATGSEAFGRFECRAGPTLLLDFEGARLTMRRLRRMARALGLDPAELDGRLGVIDTSDCIDPLHEAWSGMLVEVVRRDQIRHVVLDSYTTAMLGTAVEQNSAAYAGLARLLGRLDCLVLAVAHSNKASAERPPRLADIGGTGALGAMAQTAILVHRPDEDEEHRVRVTCGRGPESRFAPFDVVFADVAGGGLALIAEDPPPAPEKTTASTGGGRREDGDGLRRAGVRILRLLAGSATTHGRGELDDVGGEGPRVGSRARARLVETGLAELVAGHYGITPAGRAASPDEIARALGVIGGAFQA